MVQVPDAWFNVLADLDFELPPDLPAPHAVASAGPQVPASLLRQELSRRPHVEIPPEVRERYEQWRPTPLRRAAAFEQVLGTRCRLYYKYEGGNLTGSHKLNTAIAQVHYYRRAGVEHLTVGTGAGQWGTAVAAACAMFGLTCTVFMVRSSYLAKPYRRSLMELLGARVVASPSLETEVGRRHGAPDHPGSLSVALAEGLETAADRSVRFCTGSGETYSLLHQTVIGQEVQAQLAERDEAADIVVASVGGGSNFGGLALPFIGEGLRGLGSRPVRSVAVESTACPRLTRGRYAYDLVDAAGLGPVQKMYTLGASYQPPQDQAAGLRYHGSSKLLSALYDRGIFEAHAYPQNDVFASALAFGRCEGVLPAPESAHAVHGAAEEARRADAAGTPRTVVFAVSGHGLLDLSSYQAYADGELADASVPQSVLNRSLADLPVVTAR